MSCQLNFLHNEAGILELFWSIGLEVVRFAHFGLVQDFIKHQKVLAWLTAQS